MDASPTTPSRRSFLGRTKSTKSQASPPSTHSRKMSQSKQIKSKADPNAAMNESQPVAAQLEAATITSLRSITFTDASGQPIPDPDRSNPSRSRWERPLDTVRKFQENIDRGWHERRVGNGSTALHSSSNSVRNSQYGSNQPSNGFNPVNDPNGQRYAIGLPPRAYGNAGGYSPGPHEEGVPGKRNSQGFYQRPGNSQRFQGNHHPQQHPQPGGRDRANAGEASYGNYEAEKNVYPDQNQVGPSHPGPEDMAAGRDWAFQNKFGAILAYADMDNSQTNPHEGDVQPSGMNRYPPSSQQQTPPIGLPIPRTALSNSVQPTVAYNTQPAVPYRVQPTIPYEGGYRADEYSPEHHPEFEPKYEGRGPALNPISNNVVSGSSSHQQHKSQLMTPPMEHMKGPGGVPVQTAGHNLPSPMS